MASQNVSTFVQQASQLALSLGIKSLVIVIRDPGDTTAQIVASPGAMDDLREIVAEKFGFDDGSLGETGWPGG